MTNANLSTTTNSPSSLNIQGMTPSLNFHLLQSKGNFPMLQSKGKARALTLCCRHTQHLNRDIYLHQIHPQ